jgi:hypothetical protein
MEFSRIMFGQVPRIAIGAAALAAATSLSVAPDRAAAATGLPDVGWSSGCGASTCFDAHGSYRLTFSASAFGAPVDISKLLLDRSVLGKDLADFFTVSFSLGGAQIGAWGQWNMGDVGADVMTLWGSDLVWNPADGDLVLVLQLVSANGQPIGQDPGDGLGPGFYFWNGRAITTPPPGSGSAGDVTGSDLTSDGPPPGGPDTGGPPPPGGGPSGDGGSGGLQSGGGSLSGGDPAPVPEPAAWVTMIAGFGLAGAALRRRRAAVARAA